MNDSSSGEARADVPLSFKVTEFSATIVAGYLGEGSEQQSRLGLGFDAMQSSEIERMIRSKQTIHK
ncbi:UNVERIFIED_CONTAM: hypothetical protein Sangu_1706300 [Sesamum angustifolium]|uniref:Uncharacterized protein n=1 Tax=Sesamum angustifolium TaxID=2727405 RepID=A0AAW2MKY7_9LAMI